MKSKDKILIYRGVGNFEEVLVRGHYFKKYPIKASLESHSNIQNLKQAVNRFRLQPHKRRQLSIKVYDEEAVVETGADGYFETRVSHAFKKEGWFKITVEDQINGESAEGSFFVPDLNAPSVISDIDDTVLISHSTRFLRKMRLILFKNAHSRRVTKSIQSDDWMSKLSPEKEIDSYFYVSSSEWNLYDFLSDFFSIKDLPKGPFFLQRLKTSPLKLLGSGGGHHEHKLESIRFLLDFYPGKPFYLLGDSGQKDIHIYMEVTKSYPERISGVLIRKIRRNSKKSALLEAKKLFKDFDIPFHAFSDKELDQFKTDI